MRQAGTIADQGGARRLADHLLTLGITTRVDPSPEGWIVWVHREERVDEAKRELDAFLQNPDDPRYKAALKIAVGTRREAARQEKQHARNTINLQGRLNVISARRCPVTYALIAISVAVALYTNLGGNGARISPLLLSPPVVRMTMASTPADVDTQDESLDPRSSSGPRLEWVSGGLDALKKGQIWRLFTPMFLHFGIPHLVFNMMWLYQLGGLIELRKRPLVMLIVVLITAAVSNYGEYAWDVMRRGPEALVVFGGMSGVVYALFGYCWMKSDYDPESDLKIPTNTVVWMLGWLVVCMLGLIGNVANAAHLLGLVSGMAVGLAPLAFAKR